MYINLLFIVSILVEASLNILCQKEDKSIKRISAFRALAKSISKDSVVDSGTSLYIFDNLPIDSMDCFVGKNKKEIGQTLLRYYGKYNSISDTDSVFAIMSACDFSQKANRGLLSFYIHVLVHALQNKIDGYVGECAIDKCYDLFKNYPGYFYQHLVYLNKTMKEHLAEYIFMGFYYESMDIEQIGLVVTKHLKLFPQYEGQINLFYLMLNDVSKVMP